MLKLIADAHTHTVACDHAYSTIGENTLAAKAIGLEFIAMTEHSLSMPGGPDWLHFACLNLIPRVLNDVIVIRGAEVTILSPEGKLDMTDSIMENDLEWVIASMHMTDMRPSTTANHTKAWLAVAENPLVDCIGHCGDPRYAFDYEQVIPVFAKHKKIVEINSHSFRARPGSDVTCREIALLCIEHGVPIMVNSDAHHSSMIGQFAPAIAMLESINFPRELIINADSDRFLAVMDEKAGGRIVRDLNALKG